MRLAEKVDLLVQMHVSQEVDTALTNWIENCEDSQQTRQVSDQVIEALENGAHVINVPDYENKLPGWAGVAGDQWRGDALDLAHAVAKDKSLGNRLMAKAAEQLIAGARSIPNG